MAMIDIKGLTKNFGTKTVVDDISFSVEKGQIFGLLGPNGAGKTTLIRMLSTLIQPTNGTATINGYDIIKNQMGVRNSIGLLPENPCIYEKLNIYDNLKYFAVLYGIPRNKRDNRIRDILNLFDLEDRKKDLAGNLSKGLKQRLSLSITLLHSPNVLFLDEPMSGLDISTKKNINELILKLSNEERTIILSSHNIGDIQKLCHTACIINKKILKIDRVDNLIKNLSLHTIEFTLKDIDKDIDHNIISVINSVGSNNNSNNSNNNSNNPVNYSIKNNIVTFYNIECPFEWCPLVVNKLIGYDYKIIYIKEITGLEDVYIESIK